MREIIYAQIFILLISCTGTQKPNDFNPIQTSEEVYQMLDDYHKDISKEGLTAEFKYLDSSSHFFWVPPGYNTALSYDSVRSILETNSKAFQSITFQWDTLQVFPLTNAIANYSGIVNGRMVDTAQIESTLSIIESGTIIKRKDGWKLLNGQSRLLETNSEGQNY